MYLGLNAGNTCRCYIELAFDGLMTSLNPIEKKWAQAKFLRQGWMENNLPKLFHNMGCTNFIVD